MKNNLKLVSVLVLAPIFLWNCKKEQSAENSQPDIVERGLHVYISKEEFEREGYSLDTLRVAAFPSVLKTSGLIDVPPNGRNTISAIMGGYIKDLPMIVGQNVSHGEKLLTIENMQILELQQKFLETSEGLNYLQSEFKRQEELYAERISSEKNFLLARKQFEQMKIQNESLRQKLRLLNFDPDVITNENISSEAAIYAPISGSVTEIHVNKGKHVSADTPIMEIVNSDHLHLEVRVFEKDVLRIQKEQRIEFRVPEYSGEVFEAVVYLIGRAIGEDRAVKVHAHLDEKMKDKFIPGMFVQAHIFMEESEFLALPDDAILETGNKFYVLELIDENDSVYQFKKIPVEIGLRNKGIAQIDSEKLGIGDRRYLSGDFYLDP